MNHGDKLDDSLYFCMYAITSQNYQEFEKLAKAATGFLPLWESFEYLKEACAWSEEVAIEKTSQLKDINVDGASSLQQVFKNIQNLALGPPYAEKSSCYFAAFSSKKPHSDFLFSRDAANIEMMMSVLSHPGIDYVTHLGIQRSFFYALKGNPVHKNISMLLHGCAASYILEHSSKKKFMATNPLESMTKIFRANLQCKDIYIDPSLHTIRDALGIEKKDQVYYLDRYGIEDLLTETPTAIPLTALASFKGLLNLKANVVEDAEPSFLLDYNFILKMGAAGAAIAIAAVTMIGVGILTKQYDPGNSLLEEIAVTTIVSTAAGFSHGAYNFFKPNNTKQSSLEGQSGHVCN